MKLLIVDDEELGRNSLQTLLSICGFEVHTASNVEQAIQVANTVSLDAAIIDWMLGNETNGFGVAEELLNRQPETRILIISGQLDVHLRAPAGTQYTFLLKPFKVDELIAALEAGDHPPGGVT